jgi:hypothetical protein
MVDILKWIVYSGGFVVIVSWVCERWDAFQNLSKNWKQFVQIVAALVLSLGGYAALVYVPASVWVQIDPIIKLALGVLAAYGIGQIAHTVDPVRISNAAVKVAETPAPVEVVEVEPQA